MFFNEQCMIDEGNIEDHSVLEHDPNKKSVYRLSCRARIMVVLAQQAPPCYNIGSGELLLSLV